MTDEQARIVGYEIGHQLRLGLRDVAEEFLKKANRSPYTIGDAKDFADRIGEAISKIGREPR